jgi:DedD protein
MRLPFLSPPDPEAPAGDDAVATARTQARRRLVGALVLLLVGVVVFPLLFESQPRPLSPDTPIVTARDLGAPPRQPAAETPRALPPDASVEARADARGAAGIAPARPASAVGAALQGAGAVAASQPASTTAATTPATTSATTSGPSAAPAPAAARPTPQAATTTTATTAAATPSATPPKAPAAPPAKPPGQGPTAVQATTPPAAPSATPAATATALPSAPASAPAASRFVVQVGAFTDAATLRETRARVERLGLKTYTQVIEGDSGKRTRVRAGPFTTREEANAAAARLKAAGLPGSVLAL